MPQLTLALSFASLTMFVQACRNSWQSVRDFRLSPLALPGLLALTALAACSSEAPTSSANGAPDSAAAGQGTLVIRANGEDFVRQGFTSKDGWDISFDHVYVTLAEVTAYQSEPPYDPTADAALVATTQAQVAGPLVLDLAEGDASAEPIVIAELEVPAGRYNALSWRVVPDTKDDATIRLVGQATQDGTTVAFDVGIEDTLAFTCGDFVGDERKGILTDGGTADLEATFHFDHLFGDGEASADDEINTGALGFGPLAALATDGQLMVDGAGLKANLSAPDQAILASILPSLGHVGEGHCQETAL